MLLSQYDHIACAAPHSVLEYNPPKLEGNRL